MAVVVLWSLYLLVFGSPANFAAAMIGVVVGGSVGVISVIGIWLVRRSQRRDQF
jgi:hypothetical protein